MFWRIMPVLNFESSLRTEAELVENVVRLVLHILTSNFSTDETMPSKYNFKDISEYLLKKLQSEFEGVNNTVDFEFDDISNKINWL